MKRLMLLLVLIASVLVSVEAQSKWSSFFGRVPKMEFQTADKGIQGQWMFRPVVQVSAMQFNFGKQVEVAPLSSLGTGITFAHFVEQPNEEGPYMNYAFSGIVLFGATVGEVSPAKISLAATMQLWQHLSFGGGYSLSDKKFFLLTGVAFNFN